MTQLLLFPEGESVDFKKGYNKAVKDLVDQLAAAHTERLIVSLDNAISGYIQSLEVPKKGGADE